MNLILTYTQALLLKFIRLYQKTLSFDHGWLSIFFPNGYCRFQPTCSEYTYQAIKKHGLIKGGWMGMKRIFRCNPFHKGGADLVPDQENIKTKKQENKF